MARRSFLRSDTISMLAAARRAVRSAIVVATWLAVCAQPLGAEPPRAEMLEMDALTITPARSEKPSFEIPRAVTVIEVDPVHRRSAASLPDLLRGEAGAFVQETTPGQGSPILRGLIGSSVLTLVDGMRLNTALFRPAPNQYMALVDPYNVERIEILRGAGSTLYGSDAMGGVVHVITPTPRFFSEEWQARGRLLGRFASADTSAVTRASLAAGRRGFSLTGGFTYQNVEDLDAGGSVGRQRPSDYRVHAGDGKLFVGDESGDLTLSVQYLRQPKTPRFDQLVAGFGQAEPASSIFFFEPNDRLFVHGRGRWLRPVLFVRRVELGLAFQEIDDDRRTRDFGSGEEVRERNRSRLASATLEAASAWGEWMHFVYGADLHVDRIDSRRVSRDLESGAHERLSGRFADGSRITSLGFFLEDEIRLSPRWMLVAGGRVSVFDLDVPRADRERGTRRTIEDVTGSLGLLYRITPNLHAVANVGRGFRIPNVHDLTTQGSRPGNRVNLPSLDLDPETTVSADVGLKLALARLTGEVFGFYAHYDDKIEAVPTGEIDERGRVVVRGENVSSVHLAGAEAAARLGLGEGTEIFAALGYTWGEQELADGTRTPADQIPPFEGRLGVRVWPTTLVWLEGFVQFAAEQDRLSVIDRTDARIDPDGTDGWWTGNVAAGWSPTPTLALKLAVENLFDERYRVHGSGIDSPGIDVIAVVELRLD